MFLFNFMILFQDMIFKMLIIHEKKLKRELFNLCGVNYNIQNDKSNISNQ